MHRLISKKRILTKLQAVSGESTWLSPSRTVISFFNKAFIGLCKEMVRQYGKGEFKPGIFFTVKGKKVEDGIEFDFREVMYREVKACKKDLYRKKKKPVKAAKPAMKQAGTMTGFSMPGMNAMGMY